MPRIFRHIAQRMMILFLLLGGMGLVCQEAQAANDARAMWDASTKTLTFYYGEQKSGGTTHYSGTQITATGTSYPKWHTSDVYSNVTKVVFESSFANVRPASCLGWFYEMEKLTTITGINYLKTDNVTSMYCMFYGCSGLTSLNLSSFNTANVTNMAYMFYGCSGLTSLNLSSFNTANVTNMAEMFRDCSGLTSLNLSSFNTAKVTSMSYMFYGCSGLTSLNLSSFNTANVTGMWRMFTNCSSLTSLDLRSFNTAKVTSMAYMFNGCSGLTSLNLSSFNTANVTSMWRMFTNCSSLTSLDLRSFNTAKVMEMEAMFNGCSNLQIIYVDESKWSTVAVTSSTDMFYGCTKLVGGNGTVFNSSYTDQTRARVDKPGQAGYLTCATEYGTCGANGDNLTWLLSCDGTLTIRGTGGMYNWMSLADRPWHSLCTSIQRVVIEEGVTTTGFHAFYGASNLTSVSLPSTLQTLQFMTFFGCSKLTTLTIPSSVTYVGSRSLEGCSSLTDVYMSETGDAVPTMPPGIHTYDASRIRLHIPCGQTAAYVAKGWNTKFTIEEGASGSCGTNVQWHFDPCTGVLSLSGTGAMADYTAGTAPWYFYRESIITADIAIGITYVGKSAFSGCSALDDIYVYWTTADAIPAWNNGNAMMIYLHVPCGTRDLYKAKNGWKDMYVHDELGHGTCGAQGNNLTWRLYCDDWLYIRGAGDMDNWSSPSVVPWSSLRTSIQHVDIGDGVTSTGFHAFYNASNLTSVYLPSTLQTLEYMTFCGCSSLPSLIIPSSVTKVGNCCLQGCAALTDVYVYWTGDDVPTMPVGIHEYDASRIKLHIPCGQEAAYTAKGWNNKFTIEVIDSGTCGANVQWTFDPCTGALSITGTGAMTDFDFYTGAPWKPYRNYITSATIADGITNIGQYSFYACSALTSVTIPNSVTSIGYGVFDGCSSLASISIPNSVTSIGDDAFYECSSLTSVVIPNGVTSIEYSLFAQCSSLTSVTIPNSVTSIGYLAFWGCSSLTSVSIPNSVTSIENSAFWDCSSLTSIIIPNSVTSIENSTFNGCTSLTSVTIPNSVTKIGLFAFDDCHSITDIYVSWTTTAAIPTWNYLNDKTPRSSINLHVPCGTTAQYQAKAGWKGCTILEGPYRGACGAQGDNLIWELTCDGTLTISGTGAMYNWMSLADRPWHSLCTSIQRVVIEEGVTTTGFHAFYGAANLTSVSLPSTLQTLQFMTFFGCSKLTTLTIPSSVTYVGTRSLEGCSALTDVYTSWTGDAVPTMPPGIHTYDASRITLHIPCGQTAAYVAKGWNTKFTLNDGSVSGTCGAQGDNLTWSLSCDGTLTIQGTGAMADWSSSDKVPWYSYRSSITTVNIRDGVTSVGNRAFIECTALTSVTIPNSVTSISNNAFFSCSALANITIPNSVTTIGQYVFYGCSALTNITIPGSVTSLGENTFRNCSALTDIYVSWTSSIPTWPTGFTNKSPQSSITLHVPCGTGDVYAAQDGWKDYTIVANLPRVLSGTCGAVGNVANVTWSLNLCDSTLTISGTGAMRSWTSASKVPWKDYRDNIQHIVIEDGVTSIGQNAFSNCTNVTSLSIGSDVTSIGTTAFYYCTALENIIIPDNVRSIGYMAFGYCSGASTLTIGAGVNSIDQYAFISGSSLTSIVIPDNVQTLGNYAFAGCENVSSVTIGTGVNSIGDYVFALMPNITDMYVGWTTADAIPAWTTGFTQVSPQSDITLHVPCSAMSLYKAADNWQDYTIEGEGTFTITVESDDPTMGTVDAIKIDN